MTGWGELDLTGGLMKYAREDEDNEDWELIQLPAILPSGNSLWPGYWSKEEMLRTKATIPQSRWSGQYLQQPTSDTGALIKREWWRNWPLADPPQCSFTVQSWDTAFSDRSDADRSASITWGVFEADDPTAEEQPEDPSERRKVSGIILLDAYAGRLNFPELKQKALKFYKEQRPDSLVIETKGTGTPLVQELRKVGLFIEEMSAHRGFDKVAKSNSVADMFSSGSIWAPLSRKWAQELVEEMAAFPHGEFDDLHDAAVLGLLRIRRGGFRIHEIDPSRFEAATRWKKPAQVPEEES
jgi:predicted phage terminase large subunit-like protein